MKCNEISDSFLNLPFLTEAVKCVYICKCDVLTNCCQETKCQSGCKASENKLS